MEPGRNQDNLSLLQDLMNETSWPMRIGVLTGLATALGIIILLACIPGEMKGSLVRVAWVTASVLLVIGLVLGIALGALLDFLFASKKKPKRRRRRRRRKPDFTFPQRKENDF